MAVIKWKQGSQVKCEAQVAYEVIEGIRAKNNGEATAENVVQTAKPKRCPLHGDFEWNDEAAAHQHRLQRAGDILRSFVIVRDDVKTDRPQRVYEVIRQPQVKPGRVKHVYKTVDEIMADPDSRAELLGRALRDLISIRNRYRDLQELAVVLRAIDEVIASTEA